MREKAIEQRLVKEVHKRGGVCPKWTGWNGCPDRIALFPEGNIAFIETKAPGEKPRQLQEARHRTLRELGFRVYVVDRIEQIENVLDEIGGRNNEG